MQEKTDIQRTLYRLGERLQRAINRNDTGAADDLDRLIKGILAQYTEDPFLRIYIANGMENIRRCNIRRSTFAIEDFFGPYDGYTRGEYWNGWDRPYFTYEVSVKLLSDMHSDKEPDSLSWEFKNGQFLITDGNYPEEPMIVSSEVFTVDGQQVTVYRFGDLGWVWYDAERA